jgi:glycine/D-amino acid oxidase-like deaminating enzyme
VNTTSYWLEEHAEPFVRADTSSPVDVEVIGGGVTGCSCALTLAQRGLRVRVDEARTVAGGASGRNGGFALRGAVGAYDQARTQLGAETACGLWELTERTLDRLESLAGDAFRRVGSLRLAADEAERDALAAEYDALREDGFDVEWADALAGPLDRLFRGAILHPRDGALQPARWVRRLARHAAAAGAEIVEGAHADPASLDAPAVVVAADGFTSDVLPELRDLVWPVRGQVLVTEPLDERLYERPHYARGGYDYWQQLPDRRLVVGGKRDASLETENTSVEETTPLIQERLETFVSDLLGRLPPITHRWAGIWGSTRDGLPLVGRVPGHDRAWIAGGYSGHGNVLGLACGDLVARAIAGEEPPELAWFDPARFG